MNRAQKANVRRAVVAPAEENSLDGAHDELASGIYSNGFEEPGGVGLQSMPKRIIHLAWGVLVVVGIAAGVTWGVYRYTTTSPRFAVKVVELAGATRTTRDDVLKLAGVALGDNLFKLNLSAIDAKLVKDPWIRQAHATRVLPTTLHVEIEEREAAAMAVVADHLLLVTRQGEAFKEVAPDDPSDLPTITGVAVDDAPRDAGLERQRLLVAMDVLQRYSEVRLSRVYPAQEVHLLPGGEVVLMVGKKGIALQLGLGPWSKKFAMAERVFAKLQAQRSTPSLVFLDNRAHPERVVVRLN
jgi:cell division protein FtsQ